MHRILEHNLSFDLLHDPKPSIMGTWVGFHLRIPNQGQGVTKAHLVRGTAANPKGNQLDAIRALHPLIGGTWHFDMALPFDNYVPPI